MIPSISAAQERQVYVYSDGVHCDLCDNARINLMIKALEDQGVKVTKGLPRNGVRVNNYYMLRDDVTPKNAIIIQMMSGVASDTMADMVSHYWGNLDSRTIVPVYIAPAAISGTNKQKLINAGYTPFNVRSSGIRMLPNSRCWGNGVNSNDIKVIAEDVAKKAGVKKSNSGTVIKPPTSTVTIGGIKVNKQLPYTLKYGLKNGKYLFTNNAYVKVTQKQLAKKVGYDGYCQGNYGTKTALYVKKFQKKEKLPQTGQVDQKTWNALIK